MRRITILIVYAFLLCMLIGGCDLVSYRYSGSTDVDKTHGNKTAKQDSLPVTVKIFGYTKLEDLSFLFDDFKKRSQVLNCSMNICLWISILMY